MVMRRACRVLPVYTHTYIHTYIYTYIHTYIHACIHTCIHTYKHTHIHTYTHTHIHAYVHTCIHTYIRIKYKVIAFKKNKKDFFKDVTRGGPWVPSLVKQNLNRTQNHEVFAA
jgi:hypothetical protein